MAPAGRFKLSQCLSLISTRDLRQHTQQAHMHTQTNTHTHTYTRTRTHTRHETTHTRARTRAHTHIQHTHARARTCTHTHNTEQTHTHTRVNTHRRTHTRHPRVKPSVIMARSPDAISDGGHSAPRRQHYKVTQCLRLVSSYNLRSLDAVA